jgi:hypothetical protein
MSQLHQLSADQLLELHEVFISASLAHELGSTWRSLFKEKANKYRLGYKHRLYVMLSTMHFQKIDYLSSAMAKKIPTPRPPALGGEPPAPTLSLNWDNYHGSKLTLKKPKEKNHDNLQKTH